MQNNIELTVLVLTYNHDKYIRMCLDSILSQRTNFKFKILIHDDNSTDNTKKILFEYKKKWPRLIDLIIEKENQYKFGVNKMIYDKILPKIVGKYVCYLDGDDYWCNDNKLQKQYDFLEKHKKYSLCYHSSYCLNNKTGENSNWYNFKISRKVCSRDIFLKRLGSIIPSSSIMVRKNLYCSFPNWRFMFDVDDTPIFYLSALNGKIYRFKDKMSVYRRNVDNSWTSTQNTESRINRCILLDKIYNEMINTVDKKYVNYFVKLIKYNKFNQAWLNKDYKEIFKFKYLKIRNKYKFETRLFYFLTYKFPFLLRK